ncbi:unnamed protein product [Penicillium glandicola]
MEHANQPSPLDSNESSEKEKHGSDINEAENLILASSSTPPASMTVIYQGKTHFEGKFSYWTFFNSVRQVMTEDSSANQDDEEDCSDSINHPSTTGLALDWKTAVLSAMPPRDVVDFLVTTFFRSAQANYFYIHPDLFANKLDSFYSGKNEFDSQTPLNSQRSIEFISVLFMVFAIGSQFAEVKNAGTDDMNNESNETRSAFMNGTGPNYDFSRIDIPVPSPSPGWRFYEVSKRFLSDIICSTSMTSIQVCVLQGIFLPSTKNRDAGYNLLGVALRMAVNMGLHRSFAGSVLHPRVRELRNRLWWSVYVAERLFSIEMGRPLSINDAEINAPFPVEIPEWSFSHRRPTNVDNLVAMAKLCQLMGKIVENVYCKPAGFAIGSQESNTIIHPKIFRELKQELEKWRRELPHHLRLSNNLSRSVAHIALSYEQATILLTRSCLNHVHAAATRPSTFIGEEAMRFLRQQSQDCINAAVESIRILFSLHSRSLLCRFSFHDSLYCTAALYILMLREKLDFPMQTKESIAQGLVVLQDLATGSEFAASSLRHIKNGFRLSQNDKYKNDEISRHLSDDEIQRENGRKAFQAWMAQTSSGQIGTDDRSSYSHAHGDHGLTSPNQAIIGAQRSIHASRRNSLSGFDRPHVDYGASPATSDLPPFWIFDNPDANPIDRDLGAPHSLATYAIAEPMGRLEQTFNEEHFAFLRQ